MPAAYEGIGQTAHMDGVTQPLGDIDARMKENAQTTRGNGQRLPPLGPCRQRPGPEPKPLTLWDVPAELRIGQCVNPA